MKKKPVVKRPVNITPHAIFVLILFAAGFSIYKNYHLPESVKLSFEILYPQIDEYEWDNRDGNYEFNFSFDSTNTRVFFDTEGNLVKLITKINHGDVPVVILDLFHGLYPDFSIEGTEEIQMGDSINFDLKAHNGSKGVELVFGKDGQLLKKELFHWDTKWEPNVR